MYSDLARSVRKAQGKSRRFTVVAAAVRHLQSDRTNSVRLHLFDGSDNCRPTNLLVTVASVFIERRASGNRSAFARFSTECEASTRAAAKHVAATCEPVVFVVGGQRSYLVDPASSHMLVSKIKPCMSKHKPNMVKPRMAHYNSHSLLDLKFLLGYLW